MELATLTASNPSSSDDDTPLSSMEISDLQRHEQTVERGLKTFVDVGNALMAIRDGRLYRQTHRSFETYCEQRWSLSKTRAYQLISAADVAQNVSKIFDTSPARESHAAPLTSLTPDDQRTAWKEVLDTAPNGKITGAHVASVAERYKPAPAPRYTNVDDQMPTYDDVPAIDYDKIDRETGELLEDAPAESSGRHKPKTNYSGNRYEPVGNDACQTPAYALDPLLPFLDASWRIWEPACGEGSLVDAMYDSAFQSVHGSDLLTGENFFDYEPDRPWDVLITNPPYSIKYKWLERCYGLGKPFALLVPVETMGAASAQVLLKQFGFEVMLLDRRVNFKMPKKGYAGSGAQFPVMWLCWNVLPQQVMFGHIEYPTNERVEAIDE